MYFNEFDKFASEWLRKLYPSATVDNRDIRNVKAADIADFQRCHFFGGIGGWEYALQLAGWPDEWPVWTGSCPCQPFSVAGQRKGEADERHVWPEFYRLIKKCKPPAIFGEQVASKDGREWLAGVRLDLENVGYEVGAADLCAAGVGAPHARQRLYWVAYANGSGQYKRTPVGKQSIRDKVRFSNERMGNAAGEGWERQRNEYRPSGERCSGLVGFAVQAGVPQ